MMRNFKIIVEYDGKEFSGWQTQAPGFRTVQAHLEEKLERIFKQKVHVQASGRTDSGVHAIGQVGHFKVDTKIDAPLIFKALNSFLDRDVSIISVEEVSTDFHAQRDVKTKTYRYTILNRAAPSALWRDRAYFFPDKLNLVSMRKAASILRGTHDFKSFQSASQRSHIKNTIRTINSLTITKEGDLIHISIASDGFLYKMVRNIVGALIDVGRGSLTPGDVLKLLKAKDRKLASPTAPSWGLCLMSVRY